VQQALSQDSLRVSAERVATIKRERERLASALGATPRVVKVYSSDANFIMVKTRDGKGFREAARHAGILVRTFDDPLLADCVRITIGRPADNDQLLRAVSGVERASHA
jgi:histidinol-phosphate aminotransferase